MIRDSLFGVLFSAHCFGPDRNDRFLVLFLESDFGTDNVLVEELLREERDEHFLPQLVVLGGIRGNEVECVQAPAGVLLPHWRLFLSEHKVVRAVGQLGDWLQLSVQVRESLDAVERGDLQEPFLERVFCCCAPENEEYDGVKLESMREEVEER